MNQVELWWGILSVLPFGILVMLCTRCRLFGNRTIIREETRRKGQSVHMNEDKKRFEVVRSYTVSRPEPTPTPDSKTENLAASNDLISHVHQAGNTPGYGNISIANNHEQDQNYINPLAAEYYCFPEEFLKPPNDDSNSYENVEIGKTASQTSVESGGSYENCEYAVKWKHLEEPEEKRVGNNDDDDDDPDYVNTVPCPSL
ncbi:linker for activation of T-cells family member 2-like isoform X1 [Carcharodon carcharias]|uniref:linker for activation of T-cells family member 2-like isoform X1 n=2 Tax=Carcharodon carcharias TaxID=13397 RepID=UPI001B7E0AAE|nr:linker for activation of T-cells family member 2-like isoform X1 [Carcharodon carcharias]XP_041054056.1 linker for activation of T-cells family member 2-like isoform X1 [Carcharodon carcharias]XP_041054057.1 linker for activation of T-cells family member 2-like isoform X1 [Carcharodon carcharias]